MTALAAKPSRHILALVDDLFFASKLEATVRHMGHTVAFASEADGLKRRLRERVPDAAFLALSSDTLDWEGLLASLRDGPAGRVPVLGFGRHTQADRLKLARRLGCDRVVTNSQLVQRLPELLNGLLRRGVGG